MACPYLPETGGAVAFHTLGEATVEQVPHDHQARSEPNSTASTRPRGLQSAALRVPDPRFSTRTTGNSPLSSTVPLAGARHPSGAGIDQRERQERRPDVEQLRWARCPDHDQLHLLHPADVTIATVRGYARALCGQQVAADGLTINSIAYGALCMACVVAAAS
jgi:hypothetical protein